MYKRANHKNVFADKATCIVRKMLSDPKKKWVTRDFIGNNGVSLGLAHGVLETMTRKGYIERVKRGPGSYALLTNRDELLADWLAEYHFDRNEVHTYYSADKKILLKIKNVLADTQYALTVHSGANLITSFVATDHIHFYLKLDNWEREISVIREQLDLKELVRGGNIHLVRPLYTQSAFYGYRVIRGYKVVSDLQLYLDLFSFKPRGHEHAQYLKNYLEERGKSVYES